MVLNRQRTDGVEWFLVFTTTLGRGVGERGARRAFATTGGGGGGVDDCEHHRGCQEIVGAAGKEVMALQGLDSSWSVAAEYPCAL